jgi:glucuronate isomerase|tara:strand:- start:1496 stop:2326 length:831 start_codon:yes stop_codon:yes gene_type:complete
VAEKLSESSGISVSTFDDLMTALEKRHADFHDVGCRLSDHGLEQCPSEPCSTGEATSIFHGVVNGQGARSIDELKFASYLLKHFGRWAAKRGWTQQLHLGPLRNNSSRQFERLGPDTGFDSIGESVSVKSVQRYLDGLDATDELPKIVLYNLNPSDNYALTTMLGNFQDGTLAGKMQFGSGWWFLDQEEAMQWQINTLSHLGILRRFVGMLTDSRSFLSYPRHEYFRRVLCNLLGRDLKRGVLPNDIDLIGQMVREICFDNAKNYFGLELAPKYST